MNEKLIAQIQDSMASKSTEQLSDILEKNNREEWSDEAFEAIKRILTARGVKILSALSEVPSASDDATIRNKPPISPRGTFFYATFIKTLMLFGPAFFAVVFGLLYYHKVYNTPYADFRKWSPIGQITLDHFYGPIFTIFTCVVLLELNAFRIISGRFLGAALIAIIWMIIIILRYLWLMVF